MEPLQHQELLVPRKPREAPAVVHRHPLPRRGSRLPAMDCEVPEPGGVGGTREDGEGLCVGCLLRGRPASAIV